MGMVSFRGAGKSIPPLPSIFVCRWCICMHMETEEGFETQNSAIKLGVYHPSLLCPPWKTMKYCRCGKWNHGWSPRHLYTSCQCYSFTTLLQRSHTICMTTTGCNQDYHGLKLILFSSGGCLYQIIILSTYFVTNKIIPTKMC